MPSTAEWSSELRPEEGLFDSRMRRRLVTEETSLGAVGKTNTD